MTPLQSQKHSNWYSCSGHCTVQLGDKERPGVKVFFTNYHSTISYNRSERTKQFSSLWKTILLNFWHVGIAKKRDFTKIFGPILDFYTKNDPLISWKAMNKKFWYWFFIRHYFQLKKDMFSFWGSCDQKVSYHQVGL